MATLVCEDQLRAFLIAEPTVNALIGAKIYPDNAPQGAALPYVTYFRASGPRVRSLKGPSGLSHPRIQLDVLAASRASAKAIASAIRNLVDGYRGAMGSLTVQTIRVENDMDFSEDPEHAGEQTIYGVSLDAIIWFEER